MGTPKQVTTWRPRAQRAFLALGAFLTAAVLAELAYRGLVVGGQGPTTNPRYVQHDPRLGWSYRPGATARHATAEFDVAITIDADGRRAAADGTGPEDGPLILCLGDSFAFGWGVEEAESFPALLRTRLRARVLNFGVSGYGTDQQWLQLERDGLDLRPRLVIVTFCENDVEEAIRDFVYGKSKPRFVLSESGLALTNSPVPLGLLERTSLLYASVRRHIVDALSSPPSASQIEAGLEIVRRLHARMARAVHDRGGNVLVVSWSQDRLDQEVPGLFHLDVGPALTRAAEQGAVTFPVDGHWTPRGHAAVAEAIAACVERLELLRR